MKKTLIALSVLVAAGSVNAATIYENEGSSISVSGEVKATYWNKEIKAGAAKTKSSELVSKGTLQFDIAHEINADVKALAGFEYDFSSGNDANGDDVWVGLQGDFGTVKIGETGNPFGVLENVDIGSEAENVALSGDNAEESKGQGIRYSNDFGPVAVSAAYFFTTDDETNGSGTDSDKTKGTTSLSAEYSHDMFTVAAAYSAGERELGQNAGDKAVDTKVAGLSASASFGPVEFGGMFANYEATSTVLASQIADGDAYGVFAKFDAMEDLQLYVSHQAFDADKKYATTGVKSKSELKETATFFGATYTLAPKVSMTGEYLMTEAKEGSAKAEEDRMTLNLKVKF
ncbi:porin [Vibrio sp. SCSIO 43137]|uniref:porin n=1 Tax=Vibrio sp. SCSIO 43137 TaxID=3021011 RepID=UPI0023079B77|nr:porin [Vibrio sp. SCSIO 43137]WCE30692.1 porin [Vibrio sp. SCSIO 43137]